MKILALDSNGYMTICLCSENRRGKDCNHILHQNNKETKEEFFDRVIEFKSRSNNTQNNIFCDLTQPYIT